MTELRVPPSAGGERKDGQARDSVLSGRAKSRRFMHCISTARAQESGPQDVPLRDQRASTDT